MAFSFTTWLNKMRDDCAESCYPMQLHRKAKAKVFSCELQRAKYMLVFVPKTTAGDSSD